MSSPPERDRAEFVQLVANWLILAGLACTIVVMLYGLLSPRFRHHPWTDGATESER